MSVVSRSSLILTMPLAVTLAGSTMPVNAQITDPIADRPNQNDSQRQRPDKALLQAEELRAKGEQHYHSRRFKEAEHAYKEVLRLYDMHGVRRPRRARVLRGLADVYFAQDRIIEAEALYKQASRMFEASGRDQRRDVALTLINLGTLYSESQRPRQAKDKLSSAMRILDSLDPPPYDAIGFALNSLGAMAGDERKYAEAIGLFRKAIHSFDKLSDPKSSNATSGLRIALTNLRNSLHNLNRYSEAETINRRLLVLALAREKGYSLPLPLAAALDLAERFEGARPERPFEAIAAGQELADLISRHLGGENPLSIGWRNNAAVIYLMQRRLAESEKILVKSQQSLRKVKSLNPLPSSLKSLVRLFFISGGGSSSRLAMVTGGRGHALETDIVLSTTLMNLAYLRSEQGKRVEAAMLRAEALKIFRSGK